MFILESDLCIVYIKSRGTYGMVNKKCFKDLIKPAEFNTYKEAEDALSAVNNDIANMKANRSELKKRLDRITLQDSEFRIKEI